MAEPKPVYVSPDSEFARLLRNVDDEPLLVELAGIRYRIQRERTGLFADYDPDAVLEALRKSAGSFSGIDIEKLKKDLREQREQRSTGRPG